MEKITLVLKLQSFTNLAKKIIKSARIYQLLQFRDFNLYKTSYGKSVLICYINRPFRTTSGIQKHSNRRQARIIGETFSMLGFDVDVINYQYTGTLDYSKYEIVFGFGLPFERCIQSCFSGLKIYYATGPHYTQRDMAEVMRIGGLMRRRGVYINAQRQKTYPEKISTTMADAIVCTGNEWAISTYRHFYEGPIFRTAIGIHKFFPLEVLNRDWSFSKKKFLWIGGYGMIFKGLDLCIEAFEALPELELHICGDKEPEFMSEYMPVIERCDNIIFHGHVDVSSDKFKLIVEKCGYVIFPGSAEAGCGSVLTAMSTGLIPVITKETSIDIEGFGHEIVDLDIDKLVIQIKGVTCESNESCVDRSQKSAKYVNDTNNFEKYESSLVDCLKTMIVS